MKQKGFDVKALAASLYIEFCKNREVCLVDVANDSIQVDNTVLGDMLSYQCVNKGLSEILVKGEDKLESYREFQEYLVEASNNPKDKNRETIIQNYRDIKRWAKEEWLDTCRELDKKLRSYDPIEVEIMGDTREDIKILRFLEHFASIWGDNCVNETLKFKPNWEVLRKNRKLLKTARDRLFARREDTEKPLNYGIYVKAMLLVLEQLARINIDEKLYKKFLEMKWQLESVEASSVREVSVASMSINMEAAIDLKRIAERISNRHNVSVREAFLMLQDEDFVSDGCGEEIEEDNDYEDDINYDSFDDNE